MTIMGYNTASATPEELASNKTDTGNGYAFGYDIKGIFRNTDSIPEMLYTTDRVRYRSCTLDWRSK